MIGKLFSCAVASLILGAAACSNVPFSCDLDDQCVRDQIAGRCEENNRCSFRDDGCPSGYRFAPFGTDEACVPPPALCQVVGLAAGGTHSCAWFTNGKAACWGENVNGQLGDGTTLSRSDPAPVSELNGVTAVVAGLQHSCAQLGDGTVSCWGGNLSQQLGDAQVGSMRNLPGPIPSLSLVRSLSAGGAHTCAIRTDGGVHCWGRNTTGQLGDGTTTNRFAPMPVMDLGQVIAVEGGTEHSCARSDDGAVFCWGSNRFGAVGPGVAMMPLRPVRITGAPAAASISVGSDHTCAQASLPGAPVSCWGLNDLGQVGDVSLGRIAPPTPVAGTDGSVAFDAGGQHSCAISMEGALRCWGSGLEGQIGVRTDGAGTNAIPAPTDASWSTVASGGRHTCALTETGDVYCWGRLTEGQLGDGSQLIWPAPMRVSVLVDSAERVASGGGHSCALLNDGRVACWGRGGAGQLGDGRDRNSGEPVFVDLPTTARQVDLGGEFSCTLLSDGRVMCWGRGNRGQVGSRMNQSRPILVPLEAAIQIAAGSDHACAVTASGGVRCWGESLNGRLGNGVVAAGVQPTPVAVALLESAVAVTAGETHSCALSDEGSVSCWGESTFGQVGIAMGLTAPNPVQVQGLPPVTAIAAGGEHTCALASDMTVWCWGRGDSGQLGFGNVTGGIAQPVQLSRAKEMVALSAGTASSCAIRSDGQAFCWGGNRFGQLGIGVTGGRTTPEAVVNLTGVVSIETGDRHGCATLSDGSAHCWGSHQHGQIGHRAPLDRAEPMKVTLSCP